MTDKNEKVKVEIVKVTKVREVVTPGKAPDLIEKGSREVTQGNVDRTKPPIVSGQTTQVTTTTTETTVRQTPEETE